MGASHHEGSEESLLAKELKAKLLDQFLDRKHRDFPDGRLNDQDEGGLAFAVAADQTNRVVRVDFGTPVAWFALNKKDANRLAELLINAAQKIQ